MGLMEYKNTEASRYLAQKAQESAQKMEKLTFHMHEIAVKTEKETVSMRIVTVVTLFFLPGTFVSVSTTSHYSIHQLMHNRLL